MTGHKAGMHDVNSRDRTFLPGPDLPSFDPQAVLAEKPDRLGKGEMFLDEDPVGERVLVVVIHHPDAALEDDGAAVKALVHEVHGAPGSFTP